jgi:hypothetical protein
MITTKGKQKREEKRSHTGLPICKKTFKSPEAYTLKHPLIKALLFALEQHKKENKLTGTSHSGLGKYIPIVPSEWRDGTQVPTIRLYFVGDDVVSTGGADILHVSNVSGQEFDGFSGLGQLFSEYRPYKGCLRWAPAVSASLRNTSGIDFHASVVGNLDFSDGNPNSSRQAALAHDTSKQFHCTKEREWGYEFDFAPDQSWTSGLTINTNFAFLKFYSDTALGCQASETFGFVWGWTEFQFRLA